MKKRILMLLLAVAMVSLTGCLNSELGKGEKENENFVNTTDEELPDLPNAEKDEEIESVELGDVVVLNNKYLTIKESQIVDGENNSKVVVIILEGEQIEYNEEAENLQIIVPLKINTNKMNKWRR